MNKEQTLAIIKPKAMKNGHTGPIITMIEKAGFSIKAILHRQLTSSEAKDFYGVHAERFFYDDLCNYMTSGPVLVMLLEKENAIRDYRTLMGATNPEEAAPGTLRKLFGESIDYNAVHGSDAPETAACEIAFFFAPKGCCQGSC
jgi:nucleoside-diphosphate kinase